MVVGVAITVRWWRRTAVAVTVAGTSVAMPSMVGWRRWFGRKPRAVTLPGWDAVVVRACRGRRRATLVGWDLVIVV